MKVTFLMLAPFLLICCNSGGGDLVPPRDYISEVSFASSDTAWVITGGHDLWRVSGDGRTMRVEDFNGAAKLVFFLDEHTGWVLDRSGQLFKIRNGMEWEVVGTLSDARDILGASEMAFADEENGWLITSNGTLKTDNGGKNWRKISRPDIPHKYLSGPTALYLKGPSGGWFTFNKETVAFTEDNGLTWHLEILGSGERDVSDISCNDDAAKCFIGTAGGGLFSLPYHNSSKPQPVDGDWSELSIRSLTFATDRTIYAAGFRFSLSPQDVPSGVVFRSDDEGASWKSLDLHPSARRFERIDFSNERIGWLASDESLYRTIDGGSSWRELLSRKVQ